MWQGGLSPPGPVSLPGAALEYSRLGILCCTELAVLKSFSFLKALCAQGFACILKHPRMQQVNSPSLLPTQQLPNPAGRLCCKEIIEDSGYRRKTFQHTLQAVFMSWRMFCHICSLEYSAPSCPGCDSSSAPWWEQLGRKSGGKNQL